MDFASHFYFYSTSYLCAPHHPPPPYPATFVSMQGPRHIATHANRMSRIVCVVPRLAWQSPFVVTLPRSTHTSRWHTYFALSPSQLLARHAARTAHPFHVLVSPTSPLHCYLCLCIQYYMRQCDGFLRWRCHDTPTPSNASAPRKSYFFLFLLF